MRIAIIGSGYVGLVAAACLAEIGHEVICVDNDPRKIAALRLGRRRSTRSSFLNCWRDIVASA